MPLQYARVAQGSPPKGNASGMSVVPIGGDRLQFYTTFPIDGGPDIPRLPVIFPRHLGAFEGSQPFLGVQDIRLLRPTLQRYYRRVEYTRVRTVAEQARQSAGPGNLSNYKSIFPISTRGM